MSSSAVQSEMKKPSNPLRALPPIARRMPLPSAAARSATQKPLGGVKARSAGEGPLPAQYTRILAQMAGESPARMARAPPARIAGAPLRADEVVVERAVGARRPAVRGVVPAQDPY